MEERETSQVGQYAKNVLDWDKEPPRRVQKGQEAPKDQVLTIYDHKNLQRVFSIIDTKGDGKIDKDELYETLIRLGYQPAQMNQYGVSEVEQMIWEVDEDHDQAVSMEEFERLYRRSKTDKTGHEPRMFYNVMQFMCLDRDNNGRVSAEECMELIILRHGRQILDQVFRSDSNMRDIDLTEFLAAIDDTHTSKKSAAATTTTTTLVRKTSDKARRPSRSKSSMN